MSLKKLFFISIILSGMGVIAITPLSAKALTGSDFNAGRIIDDSIFTNSHAMSMMDIQAWLEAKVPVCDTWGTKPYGSGTRADYGRSIGVPPPYVCVKDYFQNPTTGEDNFSGTRPYGSKGSAQIIWEAAQNHGINPQVLLVTIQKEAPFNLLGDDWPMPNQYRTAMGYGCPDSGPNHSANCNSNYYGFYNQVNNAARQFRRYLTYPEQYNHIAGRTNYVAYNPQPSCGGSSIYIHTAATAALYNYTPYQPNASALNNLYGTGDACGAYGNRNFWRIFNDWFGSTLSNDTAVPHPDGTLINLNNIVYLIENGHRHHILSPAVFDSYNFRWDLIKPATIGDRNLPEGFKLNIIRSGKLFTAPGQPVYTMAFEGGVWKKQQLTYEAFIKLGYQWYDIMQVPPSDIPVATASTMYTDTNAHPDGTLIKHNNAIYFLWGELRHVSPASFTTNNFRWEWVKEAKPGDITKSIGQPWPLREGAMIRNNTSVFAVDHVAGGVVHKRPIGPWECFANKMKYDIHRDVLLLPDAFMPPQNGPSIQC